MHLGNCDRTIERDNGARREREELVVQREHLVPVSVGRSRGVVVDGIDRRLDLIRTRLVAAEAAAHERLPFVDQIAIPQRAVLISQQDHGAVRSGSGHAPRLDQQQQREKTEHLGLVGPELGQHATEPYGLGTRSSRMSASPSVAV